MYQYFAKDSAALSNTLEWAGKRPAPSLNAPLNRLLDLTQHLFEAPVTLLWLLDTATIPHLYATRGLNRGVSLCAICKAVLAHEGVVMLDEADVQTMLAENPPLETPIRFVAGIRIQTTDRTIGVLAVLDTAPRTLSEAEQQTLGRLANLAADAWTLSHQTMPEQEGRYQAYFEQSVEGIWCYEFMPPIDTSLPIDEQIGQAYERARLIECNDAMARMYGFDNAIALAKDHSLGRRLPPYASGNFEAVQAFFEGGYRATEIETLEYDRYGNARCFSNNVVGILEDGLMVRVWGSQTDITERWWAADALRKSEQLLSSINQNISEGIYRSTPSGDLLYANGAMVRMFRYDSPEELMRGHVSRFYHNPARRKELVERTTREHGFKNEEVEFVRKDGTTFWGLVSCDVTLDEDGTILTYDGAISDITQRKRYEQSLIDAKDQALELARLKSAFLANMSHEIRTPLTSIIGFADILAEEAPEAHQELAQLIRQSGNRLIQTLKSVLDLTRLEGETLEPNTERFDAVALAQQVLDLFRLQAKERGLELKLVAPDAPLIVWLDAGALSRILTNLTSNAMKFTETGGVTITLTAQEKAFEIQVADTGSGISEDFLPRLFSEFRQETDTLGADAEGSGLGLAITKRLVALLGGTINVESKKGQGSTFTVRLPRDVTNP